MEKVTSKLCMTKDLGLNGNLFGGNMMVWIDEAAAIFAKLKTGEEFIVTKRFGEMLFLKPVKANDLVNFYCTLVNVGNTSITFTVEAFIDYGDTLTKEHYRVFKTDCTFVAVDENGNKKKI